MRLDLPLGSKRWCFAQPERASQLMSAPLPTPKPSEQYWRKVNLEFTSRCNLRCPDCSAGIGFKHRVLKDNDWDYFVEAARWLYGIESLVIIGGEPTMGAHFEEYIPKFRELFGCKEMILWTNGYKAKEYAETLKCFDAVYASLYDERTAPWNKRPNTDALVFIKSSYNHATMEEPHISRDRSGSGRICDRGIHGPVTYADGKFYGCCVAVGYEEGIGVTPSEKWREELLATPLPCDVCMFSPD